MRKSKKHKNMVNSKNVRVLDHVHHDIQAIAVQLKVKIEAILVLIEKKIVLHLFTFKDFECAYFKQFAANKGSQDQNACRQ